jgi:S-adenosylmethionine decarboxylase proenzyme
MPTLPTSSRGRHLLLELRDCDPAALSDVAGVETSLLEACRAVGVRVLSSHLHRFEPSGVSGVVIIAESHLAVHTWPESGYAAVDLYTCGPGDPYLVRDVLAARFGAQQVETLLVDRGLPAPEPSLRMAARRLA